MLSNHYLTLKYRVNEVVGVVRGDQRIAQSCYSSAAREVMQIISLNTRVGVKNDRQEPIEELKTVSLRLEDLGKTIRIGLGLKKSRSRSWCNACGSCRCVCLDK